METLLISMCVVTLLLVTVLTLVNYKTTKVLKEEITNLNFLLHSSYVELKNSTNTLHMNLEEVSHNTVSYIDSLNTKVKKDLGSVIEVQGETLSSNRERITILEKEIVRLTKKVKLVEKGYKEKINY